MPESLLIVYVHGFKGTDVTFEQFPDRLRHVVHESLAALDPGEEPVVESKVFPVFETKGELQAATDRFVEWLTNEVITLESMTRTRAKVVLCGHSMGGLLIADAAIGIKRASSPTTATDTATDDPQSHPMWPRIIALIAFDTPYLGLHPFVFKNGLTKYAGHVEMARNVVGGLGIGGALGGFFNASTPNGKPTAEPKKPSTRDPNTSKNITTQPTPSPAPAVAPSWSLPTLTLKTIASAALLTTASAAAYYRRQDFLGGYQWIVEHAVWLKNLWDSQGMNRRLEGITSLADGTQGIDRIVFRNYYTLIPASPQHTADRTFCILPSPGHALAPCWRPSRSRIPEDEVAAHIGMFNPGTNEAFYEVGLDVAGSVVEAVVYARGRDGGV